MAGQEKKQLLLRLSPKLWESLSAWAEDDFRSINGQIEYLLTECVKKRGYYPRADASQDILQDASDNDDSRDS